MNLMMQQRWALLINTLLTLATLAADPPNSRSLRKREYDFYKIATLPTPPGVQFEAGALEFLAPDRLACSTRIGDIWLADGVLAQPPQPKWTLFQSGLHEVLSLAKRDNWLYAQQFCELTRLRDNNGDGRADVIETVNADWAVTGDYHEYAFCSKFDKNGDLWQVFCLTGSYSSDGPFRGWCLRVTPDGKSIPTCSGVRSPGGIGFNAAGDCFYTDNQGPWNGACKLQWLKPGAFVGHPGGLKWYDDPRTKDRVAASGMKMPAEPKSGGRNYTEAQRIPELLPPAVLFPYPKMGQSAAGIVCDQTGGKFGPFREQIFVADQAQSIIMRVDLEKVGDNYQGACFPFRQGFDSGCLSMAFAEDGSLFVFGTDRGWASRGGKPYSLQRLIWTGKTPFEIETMRSAPDGFRLTFTGPLNVATATDPKSYKIETFTYIYQSSYGSPEVDHTRPTITAASVSPDGRAVHLRIDGLKPGHVHELLLPGVRSQTGEPLLHDQAYYTLNSIPPR